MAPPSWHSADPHERQRARWLALAQQERWAAEQADEPHIAHAFQLLALTIELDAAPAPPQHGRLVLKGREAAHERALQLAAAGLNARAIARAVEQPDGTVYSWLRRAGLARSRGEWREAVRPAPRACAGCGGQFTPSRPSRRYCSNRCRGLAQAGHLPR